MWSSSNTRRERLLERVKPFGPRLAPAVPHAHHFPCPVRPDEDRHRRAAPVFLAVPVAKGRAPATAVGSARQRMFVQSLRTKRRTTARAAAAVGCERASGHDPDGPPVVVTETRNRPQDESVVPRPRPARQSERAPRGTQSAARPLRSLSSQPDAKVSSQCSAEARSRKTATATACLSLNILNIRAVPVRRNRSDARWRQGRGGLDAWRGYSRPQRGDGISADENAAVRWLPS